MNGLEISIPVEKEVLGIWHLILFLFKFGMQEKQDRDQKGISQHWILSSLKKKLNNSKSQQHI
jgi:hypothetical protein